MTAHAAEFFTLDEVNRLKVIQDVIDRHLTTQMAAQWLAFPIASADAVCRVTVNLAHCAWLTAVAENPTIASCLMALHSMRSILSASAIPTLACEKLAELHDVHLSEETVLDGKSPG